MLEPLADAIPLSTWIIDHTTTAPTPTTERIARWAKRGNVALVVMPSVAALYDAAIARGEGGIRLRGDRTARACGLT